MGNVAIQVEHLSKQYRIGKRTYNRDLRETLTDAVSMPLSALASFLRLKPQTQMPAESNNLVWALDDVSFEVTRGDAVGIIGNNGAGKSTLLKILSRITEPTSGEARIYGRVGSLLEVGTGFHPELTGRDNIFLSGAILGMKRNEITRKFDEIVAFAEVEKFIDTPVKHYSSGMYVRLAFAVAAHLEPEILFVDEVLAVGDVAFQKKCLGKMSDVAYEGRTVLFVSHNMGAIVQLCPQSLLLSSGQVVMIDRSEKVVHQYLSANQSEMPDVSFDSASNIQAPVIFTRCWLSDPLGNPISVVDVTRTFSIGVELQVRHETTDVEIGLRLNNGLGQPLFSSTLSSSSGGLQTFVPGFYAFLISVPPLLLAPDLYLVSIGVHRPGIQIFDLHDNVLTFKVEESGSELWQYYGTSYGNILVHLEWQAFER